MNTTDIIQLTYNEPIYPLTKREKFDEDNMKPLLSDTRFNKQDRNRLSEYNKHRLSGSTLNVSYRFGTGCEENQLGRLFPDDGIGLQSFRFDIRNPLAKKWYWDIDIDNCHYRIALRFCEMFDIKREFITQYVNDRENCLKMVSNSRKKAKTEFLKILYGGNITLYCESFTEVDGDVTQDGITFLKSLEKEVQTLAVMIWNKYAEYHTLKTGKKKKMISKKPNPKASLMSLIFQTEERKLLMMIDWYLSLKKRYMAVFIHDGGYVEKIEGETYFPSELLQECEGVIEAKMKYKIKLTQKEISYEWVPLSPSKSIYEIKKVEFEKRNFFVGSNFISIHEDGYLEHVKPNDMKIRMRSNNYQVYNAERDKMEKKYFFEEWLDDPDRAEYDRIDFNPDLNNCSPRIYNLFKGFNAEKYRPTEPISKERIAELVEPLVVHLGYLTSGNEDWLLKWLANIIQNPTRKCKISPLIRDEDGLLIKGGGIGKTLFFEEFFGKEIIGEDYLHVVQNNKELYGDFNGMFEGKLFVIVEEANSKENRNNFDYLKARTSSNKMTVNRKGINQYKTNDFSNTIFTSNNRNPLPPNRRFAFFDSNPVMKGNKEYISRIVETMEKDEVKWAFYQYLKNYSTYSSPVEFEASIPNTPAYREIRHLNAPLFLKWILSALRQGELKDDNVNELYNTFRCWVRETREGKEESMITLTAFGILLNKSAEANKDYQLETTGTKKNAHGNILFKWNIDVVTVYQDYRT